MAVLRLPAVLMHPEAAVCRMQLVQAMAATQDRVVLLDASELQQFDSSALAVLLACRRLALERGQALQVVGLSTRLQALARLYGVHELLRLG